MRYLIFLLPIFTLTSCFEIREEVNLKEDGTGEVTVVANLSQSKGKVRQYMKMERVESYYVPKRHEVDGLMGQMKIMLGNITGITYVQTKADWSNFIFSISARFDELDALNEAMVEASENLHHLGLPTIEQVNFQYEEGQFQRLFDYPPQPEEFEALPSMQRYMLESAQMVSIYRFEKKIKEHSHPEAKLSPSGRAIMLRMPLSKLVTGEGSLANTISF